MIKRYNLALIPLSISDDVVNLAKKFSHLADSYLLGHNALPHVTLYHFDAEEKEIDQIWEETKKVWKEKPIELTFNKISCTTLDNAIFWILLFPDNVNVLNRMHATIAEILRLPIKETFEPHMTLLNTTNKEAANEITLFSHSYKPLTDTFILSLGSSDDVGQYTEVIYQWHDSNE